MNLFQFGSVFDRPFLPIPSLFGQFVTIYLAILIKTNYLAHLTAVLRTRIGNG